MAGLTIATLETLFTANVKDFDTKTDVVEKKSKAIDKSVTVAKVDANTTPALAGLDKVTAESKKIASAETVAKIDADIAQAQKNTGEIKTELDILGRLETSPAVTADISKATAAFEKADTRLKALQGARAEMVVTADVSAAEASVDKVGEAGGKAGKDAGEGLSKGIIGALVSIPIAGAVVGIGVAIGKSLMDGLQVEVRSDRLMAQTGLDAATVATLARASGEAYANNFGESIASNMDTARLAVQSGLLDVDGTAKDSQAVIESLAGVADVIGEDIAPVARATATLLRTGLAKDAAGAFDIIVKGSQAGLNISEDLIDTLNEYSTQFRVLGLDGPQALGLLSQAVQGGARDTDTAADALKEFAILAIDGSKKTAESFTAIGLSADDMSAKIIAGGPSAAGALELTLTKLREMEPGAARTAAAVGLFGTKAEDLGAALYSMDLSTAVTELGTVEGAAKTALATLGDNAAGSIASAQRNIEVAADGIKGALAGAFNPQIEGFATFVTSNREAVMQFLLDMANGGIDAARSLVNGAADMTESLGAFIGGPGADLLQWIADSVYAMDALLPGDQGGKAFAVWANGAVEGMRGVKDSTAETADEIRENFIKNGLDPAQEKLNAVAIPMVAQAALHDASVAMAGSIDAIGYSGDGTKLSLDELGVSSGGLVTVGGILDGQIRTMVGSLDAESAAAAGARETQDQLNGRYEAGRVALVNQLIAMGFTADQAQILADKYGAIPANVATSIVLDKDTASAGADTMRAKYDGLGRPINTVMTITVRGYEDARAKYDGLGRPLANGGTVRAAANGMDRQSMIAPGGANILWAEPETGWETYISGKPSQRTRNIGLLKETASRFGLTLLDTNTTTRADGGTASATTAAPGSLAVAAPMNGATSEDIRALGDRFGAELQRQARTIQTIQRQLTGGAR